MVNPDDLVEPRPAPGVGAIENVAADVHVGEQRQILRDVADAPFVRRTVDAGARIEERSRADPDHTVLGGPQAGDRLEHGRLAGARRPEERDDPGVDVFVDLERECALAEGEVEGDPSTGPRCALLGMKGRRVVFHL